MIPHMTLSSPIKAAPGLATAEHPYFVGLALLRSLLAHDEVAQDSRRSDAVLDMITILLRQGQAGAVVRAFSKVRQACGPVCYLAIFRLRRWLEQQVMVRAGEKDWEPVKLAFADYRRVVQGYQREAWEWDTTAAHVSEVPVNFAWAGVIEHADERALQPA